MKLVLDTNIYCDYAEGIDNVVDTIATYSNDIYIPSIVIGELNYGFMKGSRKDFNEKKLKEVITRLEIDVINVNQDVAKKYAFIFLSLSKKGKKIPINDVWIAACCMDIGGTLLTKDMHFDVVDQVESIIL
ncbi:MAG: type II toxin-antitoxin system VapC family toxin [Candidatus Hydrothermarchaeales archaeon]